MDLTAMVQDLYALDPSPELALAIVHYRQANGLVERHIRSRCPRKAAAVGTA